MPVDDLYVPDGVYLKCDQGATITNLVVTPKKHKLYGVVIATEKDNIPIVNIPCFGACSSSGNTCIPKDPQWKKVHEGATKIEGQKPLLETSYCKCMQGGNIDIFFDEKSALTSLESDKKGRVDKITWLDATLGFIIGGPTSKFMTDYSDIGRGFRQGGKGTWNFLSDDMWKGETWSNMGSMAMTGIVGYMPPMMSEYPSEAEMEMMQEWMNTTPEERIAGFDKSMDTDLTSTHEGIKKAGSDFWDRKIENGTYAERGVMTGEAAEFVVELFVGSKGAGAVAKGIKGRTAFANLSEKTAKAISTINEFAKASKLGKLAESIKGIFKVGRWFPIDVRKFVDDITRRAEELIQKAADKIPGFSNKANGPCLSGVYDPVTGKTSYGQNFLKNQAGNADYAKFVDEAHPIIQERIKAQQKLFDEGKLPEGTDLRAGAHSEVRALDEAIKAREAATGKPVTEADLKDFYLHNRHMPSNTPFHRCVNCSSITDGVKTVGGHN